MDRNKNLPGFFFRTCLVILLIGAVAQKTAAQSLELSALIIAFSADSGGPAPTSKTISAFVPVDSIVGLSVSGAPSWLTVTPASTAGSEIVIANTVNPAGLSSGSYQTTITVSSANNGSNTYAVTFTVRSGQIARLLSSVVSTPPGVTVAKGASIQFLADPLDQFGKHFDSTTVTWTVSGGGTISGGLFTADTVCGGAHLVIATAQKGAITAKDTSFVVISTSGPVHKKINSGSNTLDVAGWERDDGYVSGGSDTIMSAGDVTAGITGAAPADVYRSVRHGSPHGYTVSSLPAGAYTVRMHFVEPLQTGRKMSYTISGVNVLQDFDVATRAGGINRALPLDFIATVAGDGKLQINGSASTGDVFEAGLEIISNERKSITILSPVGGETFKVGQKMTIRWSVDNLQVSQVLIYISVDDGISFVPITTNYGISTSDTASWEKFEWTVPETLITAASSTPMVSRQCLIEVTSYTNAGLGAISDTDFTITNSSAVRDGRTQAFADGCRLFSFISQTGLQLAVVGKNEHFTVELVRLDGSIAFYRKGYGAQTYIIPPALLGSGYYLARMTVEGKTTIKTIITNY